jgi:selenocysteine lyase/cysteine desulfurase
MTFDGAGVAAMGADPVVAAMGADPVDVRAIRRHFVFAERGRVVTNNAASTQPPAELLELYRSLGPGYENVHRGQSGASQAMTWAFEEAYATIAGFVGAAGPECIALYRNTTEAVNAVMYGLLTEFADGDNVVTTLMEHNSNYIPRYGMCREILPRLGRRVGCALPFLYGGDMIAEGQVFPDRVGYNCLPWKYAAGTPNILGTIVSAQALRLLADLALSPRRPVYFGTGQPLERAAVADAMGRVAAWNRQLTARALDGLAAIPGITLYGPADASRRTSLVAFNLAGRDPVHVAEALDRAGIEARAGCHCATLAHHTLGLDPPASCRLSFYLYNTPADIDAAVAAVAAIATGHHPHLAPWYRRLRRPARPPVLAAPA